MNKTHTYKLNVEWTGNLGTGTSGYRAYTRNHIISAEGKPIIDASSDPTFRGDKTRYNPEEMLLAALSSCHMLSFLHMAADAGVIVTSYTDNPIGNMVETSDGGGHFTEVILRPTVTVTEESMISKMGELHHKAHHVCFIARSVNFPVNHEPNTIIG